MADKKKPARRRSVDPVVASYFEESRREGPELRPEPEVVEPAPIEAEGHLKGRKRRKDATGRKADYHQGSATLTVRLLDEEVLAVKKLAADSDQSVNAWLQEAVRYFLERGGIP